MTHQPGTLPPHECPHTLKEGHAWSGMTRMSEHRCMFCRIAELEAALAAEKEARVAAEQRADRRHLDAIAEKDAQGKLEAALRGGDDGSKAIASFIDRAVKAEARAERLRAVVCLVDEDEDEAYWIEEKNQARSEAYMIRSSELQAALSAFQSGDLDAPKEHCRRCGASPLATPWCGSVGQRHDIDAPKETP